MQFIRTNSQLEQFTNPERDAHHQMELLFSLDPTVEPDFASLVDNSFNEIPNSPQSQQSDDLSIMEDLDSIFEDVINSPVPSPLSPTYTTTTTIDDFFASTPLNDNDIDAIEPTICQVYPEIAEPKHEPECMEIESNTTDYDFAMLTPPETPATPAAKSSRKTKLPTIERQQRKRKSNKESSRRYREKVKNRESDLIKSLDELIQKKRTIELDLAKTKAVNGFLVDQLRAKFGHILA